MLGGFAEDAVTKREQTGSRTPGQRDIEAHVARPAMALRPGRR